VQKKKGAMAAVRNLGARGCAATPRLMVGRRNRGTKEITATAAASVRGCAGGGRAGARGKARAGYVGSGDAMQRVGLRENL
jgi:hypothetical protein